METVCFKLEICNLPKSFYFFGFIYSNAQILVLCNEIVIDIYFIENDLIKTIILIGINCKEAISIKALLLFYDPPKVDSIKKNRKCFQ